MAEAFQLPALSKVLTWKYQLEPSANGSEVMDSEAVSTVVSGVVVLEVDHS